MLKTKHWPTWLTAKWLTTPEVQPLSLFNSVQNSSIHPKPSMHKTRQHPLKLIRTLHRQQFRAKARGGGAQSLQVPIASVAFCVLVSLSKTGGDRGYVQSWPATQKHLCYNSRTALTTWDYSSSLAGAHTYHNNMCMSQLSIALHRHSDLSFFP